MFKEAIISTLMVTNLMMGIVEEPKIEIPFITDDIQVTEPIQQPAGEMEDWVAQEGDVFQVNVAKNVGYLIHPNGSILEFELLTGQQHNICYMRKCYFGGTPVREWEVKSMDIKGDRVTFGVQGKFLRMYKDGESSPYGIHGHKYYQSMIDSNNHYRSYGCIIVSEEILQLIEDTYKVNGNYLKVQTGWEE